MSLNSQAQVVSLEIPQVAKLGHLGRGLRLHSYTHKARVVIYLERSGGASWLPIHAEIDPAATDVYVDRRRANVVESLAKQTVGAVRRRLQQPFLAEDLDALFEWSDRKAKAEVEKYPWHAIFDAEDARELRERMERKFLECDTAYADPFQAALSLAKELSYVCSLDPDQDFYGIVERRWERLAAFGEDEIEAALLEEACELAANIRKRSAVWKNLPDYPMEAQVAPPPSGMPR